MNKKLLILIMIAKAISGAENCPLKQQGMLIFIDEHDQEWKQYQKNKEPGSIAEALKTALRNGQNSIIVVSKSLAALYCIHYKDAQATIEREREQGLEQFIVVRENFSTQWILFEVDDYCVLIPKKHPTLKELLSNLNLSSWQEIENHVSGKMSSAGFEHVLQKIFQNTPKNIQWIFFMNGHGRSEEYIVGISVETFQKVLDFFETKIRTKIVLYASCYAGGINKIKAFNEPIKEGLTRQKIYSFPIIVLSPTDLLTCGLQTGNFDKLIDGLSVKSDTQPDYFALLKESRMFDQRSEASNFPQIRLPGMDFFSVEALNRLKDNPRYVIISQVQARTRSKDLIISRNIDEVLSYVTKIPFRLVLQDPSNKRQKLVWINQACDNIYEFTDFHASNHEVADICRFLTPLWPEKKMQFNFKRLTLKNMMLSPATLTMAPQEMLYTFILEGDQNGQSRIYKKKISKVSWDYGLQSIEDWE